MNAKPRVYREDKLWRWLCPRCATVGINLDWDYPAALSDALHHVSSDEHGESRPDIAELRRAMVDAHPDRGGSWPKFEQARDRYLLHLRSRQVLR